MNILLTGGSGRLGQELQQNLDCLAPSSKDLDISKQASVADYFLMHKPSLVVHCAAYTNVSGAESERTKCWHTNVIGTENLIQAANQFNAFFIHISTDYVFWGDKGMYKEDDTPGPVRNYYALTKLVAESIARQAHKHLIIRTSFRPLEWPYPSAFADVYTSQDYVDVLTPDILLAINHHKAIAFDTLHIATERKSVYDLALRRKKDVQKGSKATAGVDLPDDISLDTSRWQTLKAELERAN